MIFAIVSPNDLPNDVPCFTMIYLMIYQIMCHDFTTFHLNDLRNDLP